MKVLYIDVAYKKGSTGKIVFDLLTQCKERGIESFACFGRGSKINDGLSMKFGYDIETFFHAIMTRITGYTGCFSYFSTKKLIRFIKKYKPEIVHIHELHAYFVNIKPLLLFLKKNNIKTVFTNHCEFLYTGKCGYSLDCIKYSLNCGNCSLLKEYPKTFLFDKTRKMLNEKRMIFENWDNIVVTSPSQWLNNKLSISFLKNKRRIVVNNGIDTSLYSVSPSNIRQTLSIPLENKIVLTAAFNIFSDVKGGDRFVSIANKMKNEKMTFIVVGGSKSEIKKYSSSNTIVLPLIKEKEQLMNLYSASDVFVICSNRENFPTTCLEAQCCGTKIAGYDIGGIKETILFDNGGVVTYGDEDSLIKLIKTIACSGYDKIKVSLKAKEHFSKEQMFEKYIKIYEELMENEGSINN